MSVPSLRAASPADAPFIGERLVEAGGGVFEVLLDGLLPGVTAAETMAQSASEDQGPFSWRYCRIVEEAGRPLGLIDAFPAVVFAQQSLDFVPVERHVYVEAVTAMLEQDSFYIGALAIAPAARRRGLAAPLLASAFEQARASGFRRVTLHVWAGNATALGLYLRLGFEETGSVAVPPHTFLRHGAVMLALGRGV